MNKKVENIIDEGIDQLELAEQCRNIELQEQVSEISNGQYEVSFANSFYEGDVGARIRFLNEATESSSGFLDFEHILSLGETKTNTFDTTVNGANKIEVTPFIIDELGEEFMCPTVVSNI